jgi:phenylpyruvate tautomerase PptA (4-oxalocrotonate tautomerase family)
MPLYQCATPAATLDDEGRQRIAREVTRIHCELTGAPPDFVHVLFVDSSGAPGEPAASVLGSIRAGRPEALRLQLAKQVAEAVAGALGVGAERVVVRTLEIPAAWVMEGGALLPEPGDEERWLVQHGAALRPH